jgi:hypothetical protein
VWARARGGSTPLSRIELGDPVPSVKRRGRWPIKPPLALPFYAALRMRSIDTAAPVAVAFMLVHLLRVAGIGGQKIFDY